MASEKAYDIWLFDLEKKMLGLFMVPTKVSNISATSFREEFDRGFTTKEIINMLETEFRNYDFRADEEEEKEITDFGF